MMRTRAKMKIAVSDCARCENVQSPILFYMPERVHSQIFMTAYAGESCWCRISEQKISAWIFCTYDNFSQSFLF